MKRSRSLIVLILVLIVVLCNTGYVKAMDYPPSDNNTSVILCADDLPEADLAFFRDKNVLITEDTIIRASFVNEKSSAGKRAIKYSIINEDKGFVTEDMFLFFGSRSTAIDESERQKEPGGDRNSTLIIFPTAAWGVTEITIHATAVYSKYSYGGSFYYHPEGISFYYIKNESCTVSYIGLTYYCGGGKYTYPGYVFVGDDYYSKTLAFSYPTSNHTYAKYSPYDSNYVLELSGMYGGHKVDFSFTIDGVSYYYPYTVFG